MNRQLTEVRPIKSLFTYQTDKDLNNNRAVMSFSEMDTVILRWITIFRWSSLTP